MACVTLSTVNVTELLNARKPVCVTAQRPAPSVAQLDEVASPALQLPSTVAFETGLPPSSTTRMVIVASHSRPNRSLTPSKSPTCISLPGTGVFVAVGGTGVLVGVGGTGVLVGVGGTGVLVGVGGTGVLVGVGPTGVSVGVGGTGVGVHVGV